MVQMCVRVREYKELKNSKVHCGPAAKERDYCRGQEGAGLGRSVRATRSVGQRTETAFHYVHGLRLTRGKGKGKGEGD